VQREKRNGKWGKEIERRKRCEMMGKVPRILKNK